jgi:hypothetical protein
VKKAKTSDFGSADRKCLPRPDLYILDENQSIVLILEKKAYGSTARPEAQLIAAFRHNNRKRQELHLDPLPHAVIPGIPLTGTAPTFLQDSRHSRTAKCSPIRHVSRRGDCCPSASPPNPGTGARRNEGIGQSTHYPILLCGLSTYSPCFVVNITTIFNFIYQQHTSYRLRLYSI